MRTTPQWAAASQHIIRCIRCKTISLCLCWCYLQMNTVLCCSEHALIRSALWWWDYFSKHCDTLPVFLHSKTPSLTLPDLSFLSFLQHHPPSVGLRTSVRLLYLHLGLFDSTFSLSSLDFPMSQSNIFSLTSFLLQSHSLFSAGWKQRVAQVYRYRTFTVSFNRGSVT